MVARARRLGYVPVVAAELEFYVLAREPGDGPVPGAGLQSGLRHDRIDAYGLGRLDDMSPLFDDLYATARALGLPVRTLMSEYAPGQFEITLEHRPDALRAIDEAILFKRALRGVAARHGRIASFMAKPFAERAGSGMHLHASLADAAGTNLFASEDPAGTPLLRHAIGGLKATLGEAMAIWAPHANSYRRFRVQSYAPVAPTWGINNRTVSLRVPAGAPASRHVEHRVAGADANPYLVAAVVLAGMLEGIERGLDPGPAVEGNGYAQAGPGVLPMHWPRGARAGCAFGVSRRCARRGLLDLPGDQATGVRAVRRPREQPRLRVVPRQRMRIRVDIIRLEPAGFDTRIKSSRSQSL